MRDDGCVRLAWVWIALALMMIPSQGAESYIVVDAKSGVILESRGEEVERQVASLTKTATILLALDWARSVEFDMESLLPVSAGAIAGGANPLDLRSGDQISMRDAIYASMMASDNTSAYVIAEAVGSEIDSSRSGDAAVSLFVEKMNGMAEALGMAKTRFVNPHGLDGDADLGYSTAADMARLTLAAYQDPEFLPFVSEKELAVKFHREGKSQSVRLINTNELVGSRGVDGVKTGTTFRAGPCLIASAVRDEARLVAVVLKAEDRFKETVILLNRGWESWDEWQAEGGGIETKDRLLIETN